MSEGRHSISTSRSTWSSKPPSFFTPKATPVSTIGTSARIATSSAIRFRSTWIRRSLIGSNCQSTIMALALAPATSRVEDGVVTCVRVQDAQHLLRVKLHRHCCLFGAVHHTWELAGDTHAPCCILSKSAFANRCCDDFIRCHLGSILSGTGHKSPAPFPAVRRRRPGLAEERTDAGFHMDALDRRAQKPRDRAHPNLGLRQCCRRERNRVANHQLPQPGIVNALDLAGPESTACEAQAYTEAAPCAISASTVFTSVPAVSTMSSMIRQVCPRTSPITCITSVTLISVRRLSTMASGAPILVAKNLARSTPPASGEITVRFGSASSRK